MASNGLGMSTPHTQQSPMSMASMASMANMASMPSTPMKSPQVGMAGSKGDFIYIKHEVRKHLVVFYCNFVFFFIYIKHEVMKTCPCSFSRCSTVIFRVHCPLHIRPFSLFITYDLCFAFLFVLFFAQPRSFSYS